MKYANIYDFDISNGPGIRVSLFVSGCDKHCLGCFNPETWDFSNGKEYTKEVNDKLLELCSPDWISGLSILGGEPLHPSNISTVEGICARFKEKYPEKSIWIWTGYTMEELVSRYQNTEFLDKLAIRDICFGRDPLVDTIVDGPFIKRQKDLSLKWRGSSNQRIWVNRNGILTDETNRT